MTNRFHALFSALAVAALLFVTGCSKSPEQKLVGTWALSADQTMEAMGDEVPEGEEENVRGALEAMAMTVTFGADGNVTMAMGEREPQTATYTAAANDDGTLTVTTTEAAEEGEEAPEPDTSTVTFVSDDLIHMSVRNDTMAFVRQ